MAAKYKHQAGWKFGCRTKHLQSRRPVQRLKLSNSPPAELIVDAGSEDGCGGTSSG